MVLQNPKVLQAYTNDVGRGIIRLNPAMMKHFLVIEGDIVLIKGETSATVGRVKTLYKNEQELNIARMDGLMRNNVSVHTEDQVSIERIDTIIAKHVKVAPEGAFPRIDERYLADALDGVPLKVNDSCMVPYFGGRLTFQVIETIPAVSGVLVSKNTEFEIIESPEKLKKIPKTKKEDQVVIRDFIGRRIFSLLKDLQDLENVNEKKQRPLIDIVWTDFMSIITKASSSFPNNDFIPTDIKSIENVEKTGGNIAILQYIKFTLRKLADALEIKHLELQTSEKIFGNDVFIVHGHDETIKEKTARFIEKIDLKPIILHEQPNKGRTIIEKFEDHSSKIGFAVILLTPDDTYINKKDDKITEEKRARQNVILELGFFVGAIGRKRTCVLHTEGVVLPSDSDGVLFIPADKNDAWKLALAKEIKESGIPIDLNKII